ncbi:cytochrome c peroxidase [Cupriavidus sp. WKF15]|uniref:cytochrome-c peroxidase n=1 Tax=Cupriavidus sp. WKF15 TaxID=3032282 RepID=UPI0023E147DA|nr:cytochrome c peroxidase [Cupriavidus sp. WKF15]WER48100.1 cytochrome c peroxidase [Cupriavidus sp. WKF15]
MSLPPLLWNAACPSPFTWLRVAGNLLIVLLVSLMPGCGKPDSAPATAKPKPFYAMMAERHPDIARLSALGKALFSDPSLSASGKQSCASCHSPEHAYGPANNLSVQLGGADMARTGVRAAPSIRYVQNLPAYTDHYHENDGNDAEDQGPTGGHNWDGRANSAHDQARVPLLSAHEMANAEPRVVVEKIRGGPYAETLRAVLGKDVLDDEETAFNAVLMALEVFQQTPAEFYPYTSKYDAVLRGQAHLTAQELRGLRVFNDPNKGNCAACHPSDIREGALPAFSDFGFIAVGAPRNRKLAGNADPAFYDMGLCGPDRTDLKDRADYCGRFRTPSLRNVALRQAFFHNGIFHSLDEVLYFYAERDVKPEKWYSRDKDGKVRKFDDLPSQYHGNVNIDAPFGGKPGDKPPMTEAEMRDVIAFLKTLTDGYRAPVAATNR